MLSSGPLSEQERQLARGVTRTYGPLHFEDLEPRRFEDLVRQLVYDFRPWRMLEATGRAGSDDGFDARGFEIVELSDADDFRDDDDERPPAGADDRLWLIQCKRERTITPARLKGYLADMPDVSTAGLYGAIFVGACDFSKTARDAFRDWCGAKGIGEAHIWGKGELEDLLYQPRNDGLLFAYFGFSLRIRRRSVRTELRARLAMKRKAERILSPHQAVLLRDPMDDRYPQPDKTSAPARWRVAAFFEHHPNGIMLLTRSHYAFLHDDGKQWDYIERSERPGLNIHDDPWASPETTGEDHALQGSIHRAWSDLPAANRAKLWHYELVYYDEILDIDEKGDIVARMPHLFLDSVAPRPERSYIENSTAFAHRDALADPESRIDFFPKEFPAPPREELSVS